MVLRLGRQKHLAKFLPRYALLHHTDAPDDPQGSHIDLLLEDGESCRSWRLASLPQLDQPAQDAIRLPAHRLIWLEPRRAAVSGGRGWAERIRAGFYDGDLPDDSASAVDVRLSGDLQGRLQLGDGSCRLSKA